MAAIATATALSAISWVLRILALCTFLDHRQPLVERKTESDNLAATALATGQLLRRRVRDLLPYDALQP